MLRYKIGFNSKYYCITTLYCNDDKEEKEGEEELEDEKDLFEYCIQFYRKNINYLD